MPGNYVAYPVGSRGSSCHHCHTVVFFHYWSCSHVLYIDLLSYARRWYAHEVVDVRMLQAVDDWGARPSILHKILQQRAVGTSSPCRLLRVLRDLRMVSSHPSYLRILSGMNRRTQLFISIIWPTLPIHQSPHRLALEVPFVKKLL